MLSVKHLSFLFLLCSSSLARTFSDSRLEADFKKLTALAAANDGVVKLDSALYDVITAKDREWSVAVQLTALGKEFKCAPCKEFDPSFKAVSKAWWKKVPKEKKEGHFFATLDFADGQEIFRRLGLSSAPFVNFWPAAKGEFKPANGKTDSWTYDFGANEFDPVTLAVKLSPWTPVAIPYSKPPNYDLMITVAGVTLGLAVAIRFFYLYLYSFITSRWTWAVLSVGTSLVFISGHMFTRIRATPFAMTRREGMEYIAPGYQNQYGFETQMVAALYGTLAFTFVALTIFVPKIQDQWRQRLAIYVWVGVLMIVYSLLLSVFRMKNGGYPFRLFL